ncbi:hypothetical protein [Tropicimonas sp. IMCC6043]|uniref:hypothetical protein n=1 Tax=Tropicimonas sp. IMCC6043 TaxID=2510645 RepID=UPI00101E0FF5|nr:hypothetical protein [Tropicimonas sp. IMCC6043]RYH06333.1 hypothetical protein EU800_24165 [Tropicimonas sp. IMCC6043]
MAVLAIAVNLVELACSADLPAVYTQTLAMHDLSMPVYYGYLLHYLEVFLMDDIVFFVAAMVTLRAAAGTGRYSQISHLIGGVVLMGLGVILVLRHYHRRSRDCAFRLGRGAALAHLVLSSIQQTSTARGDFHGLLRDVPQGTGTRVLWVAMR